MLKKAPITFSDDSDSDISSLDGDNIFSRPPQGNPRRIDTETAPSGDGSAGNGSEFTDKEVGADLVQAQVPRRISEKDRVKLRMEAERLKRSLPVSVPEIVNEKKTMSWLLQETQNKLYANLFFFFCFLYLFWIWKFVNLTTFIDKNYFSGHP